MLLLLLLLFCFAQPIDVDKNHPVIWLGGTFTPTPGYYDGWRQAFITDVIRSVKTPVTIIDPTFKKFTESSTKLPYPVTNLRWETMAQKQANVYVFWFGVNSQNDGVIALMEATDAMHSKCPVFVGMEDEYRYPDGIQKLSIGDNAANLTITNNFEALVNALLKSIDDGLKK